jgi:carboxynorspermidine decarboxylase
MIKDWTAFPTPSYVIDTDLLTKNLEILKYVIDKADCKILLAQKCFSMFSTYKLIGKYLTGCTASSLFEAKLGYEEMGKENHIFSAGYTEKEIDEISAICTHLVFNSMSQVDRFSKRVKQTNPNISLGLRVNPEYSEITSDIYNPCITGSRLGIIAKDLEGKDLSSFDGIHFHTMCEQGADTLERTLMVVEEKFGKYIYGMKWLNMGGGHHITKEGYDLEKLISLVKRFKEKFGVEVYLEPGEAVALDTGFLVSEVVDIVKNGLYIAILDASAACHMPDVIEMPYRPYVIGSKGSEEYKYTYRLAGPTCLAGDVIGDYSFLEKLKVGDKLVFTDMAIYTMVKNNTFNGFNLPSIITYSQNDGMKIVKEFGYNDFKNRLS